MKTKTIKSTIIFITIILHLLYLANLGLYIPHFEIPNILLFILFTYISTYIHELGHVLAALLSGMGINRVIIGTGKPFFRKKIYGILVILNRRQGNGYTFIGEIKKGFSKPAYLFFVAGGFLLQIIFIIPLILITDFRFSDFIGSYQVSVSASFIMANLVLISLNLIPMRIQFREIKMPNDGFNLLRIPFLKQHEINEILSAGKIMEAYELIEAKKYKEAQLAYELCLNDFPESIVSRINYSVTLIRQMILDKAEVELVNLINMKSAGKYHILIYNNLAFIELLKFTGDSIKEADVLSQKACKINSEISYVQETRGSVLIVLEQYDEGIKLIKESLKHTKTTGLDEITDTMASIFLLFAYLKTDNIKAAEKHYRKIKKGLTNIEADEKHIIDNLKKRSLSFAEYLNFE